MKDIVKIITDIYSILGDDLIDYLEIEIDSNDPLDGIMAKLFEENIVEPLILKEWIKTTIGKAKIVKFLKDIELSFDKKTDIDTLVSIWFDYRQINSIIPRARPIALARNLLEIASQICVSPDNFDASLILNQQFELLLRYVTKYYVSELWQLKAFEKNFISEFDDLTLEKFEDMLGDFSIGRLCEIVSINQSIKKEPYRNIKKETICLSNEEIGDCLLKIKKLYDNINTEEDKIEYCNSVFKILNYWLNENNNSIIPNGYCISSAIKTNIKNEIKCYDDKGKEINLFRPIINLDPGDNILLNPDESNNIWVFNIKALPEDQKWTTPKISDTYEVSKTKNRNELIISYSDDDKETVETIKKHLIPFSKNYGFHVWTNEDIRAGDDWENRKREILLSAKVAIVCISANYFATEHLMDLELPFLLKAYKNEEIKFLWLLVSPCVYQYSDISKITPLHDINKPINSLNSFEKEAIMVEICTKINQSLND